MPAYYIGIQVNNTFYVTADSPEEAERMVRDYDSDHTLRYCEYNIANVDLVVDDYKIADSRRPADDTYRN
mgnify:FL=1|jgi:hypothetical protein